MRGLTAGVGTNVHYAIFVESNEGAKHRVGGAHFMERGGEASMPFIKSQFEKAMENLAGDLTKQ